MLLSHSVPDSRCDKDRNIKTDPPTAKTIDLPEISKYILIFVIRSISKLALNYFLDQPHFIPSAYYDMFPQAEQYFIG